MYQKNMMRDRGYPDRNLFFRLIRIGLLMLLIISPYGRLFAADDGLSLRQAVSVTGTVVDASGMSIPGANVLIKGTLTGTVTDIDGKYTINVPNKDAVLAFSFVGYVTQEFTVGDKTQIDVILEEESRQIAEVVVVGYGTQKKVNLTGAVSAVDMSKMAESRPITSLSAGLSGLASGVFVSQNGGGRPGNDGATIRVRGQGTLNNSDPLVVIDGAVGNMNDVNPQDVESISVLKDAASASIYGSRAANGVILVTTRKGKTGEAKISYNGYVASQKVSNKMNIVSNYADYMELMNEGLLNSKQKEMFSDAKIQEWRDAGDSDPLRYPNTDWQDEIFRRGWLQSHTLSVNGGSEKIRYFISGNYMKNPGIMENADYKRFSGRANIDADVKKWLTVGVNAFGFVSKNGVITDEINKDEGIFTFAPVTTPGMVFRAPDGRYGGMNNPEDSPQSASNNPLYRLNSMDGEITTNKIVSRFFGKLTPLEGLNIEGSYTYDFTDGYRYSQPVFHDLWSFYSNTVTTKGTGRTSVTNKNERWIRNQMDLIGRYERVFRKHLNFQIMVGASQESYVYKWFQGVKMDMIAPGTSVLDAATADPNATGNSTRWAMHSIFSRLNLTWADKYMFEANFRADASSRFASGGYRWGQFPSFSAGWRITEEDFLKDQLLWLNSLKLRASWGALGNNSPGANRDNDYNFGYQTLYGGSNYTLNNIVQIGLAQQDLSNPVLTWETTYVSNIGVDFAFLRSRLSGTVDFFIKNTKGILIDLPAPLVHGTTKIPKQNAAKVRNSGVELNLSWNDKINEKVDYYISGNFSYVKNKVTKFKGNESAIDGTNMIVEGKPINVQYLLSVDRIIQTDADLAVAQAMLDEYPDAFIAYYPENETPKKGDFLYKDTNGDGKINDDDRITTGNGTNPTVTYGLSFGATWNGFDFSCLLQGVAGLRVFWGGNDYRPTVRAGYQINKDIADGRWYEGRTDADFPRLLQYSDTRNSMASDWWIQNKAYMRVKNIQLGYTIPKDLLQKIFPGTLRIYGSIDNALTFTSYKGLDPEVDGTKYPPIRQTTIGLNLTF